MKTKFALLAAVSLLTLGLAGCTVAEKNSNGTTDASSTVATKTVSDYLAGLDSRSLTADNQTPVDLSTLDSEVAATDAVSFTGESQVKMILLQFKSQDDAMTAQSYYVGQGMQTHTDQRLLLVAERTLGKDWFAKYQKGIFQQ